MNPKPPAIPFWRDERILKWLWQAGFVLLVVGGFAFLINNMLVGLQKQGMTLGISFMSGIASFDIGEMLIPYDRSASYWRAFQVGLLNTLFVSVVGIFFSTILGIVLGVARLSSNWLVNRLSAFYLELFRNLSLLVFLIFWYLGVFLKLPRVKEAVVLWDSFYFTNRGIGMPWGLPTSTWDAYRWILGLGLLAAWGLGYFLRKRNPLTSGLALFLWGLLAFLAVAVAGWFLLPVAPLAWDLPIVKGLNLNGGKILSPEFMALTSGLVLYTAAFSGETVRAGILSVSKGQFEAARALGFNDWMTLRLIVFPQALRVIIPPLTSQYLNLTKNSSLAIAIGFADVFYVSNTIINQSGRAVEVIVMVMLTYLSLSLLTSAFMNWYNQKTRLVER